MLPVVGCWRVAASDKSVDLPAPLGPSTTQRSSAWTTQSMSDKIQFDPRRTPTRLNARTCVTRST